MQVVAELAAIAESAETCFLGTASTAEQPTLRALGRLVMMLMTPLTALASHTLAPGPRMISIRSMSSSG